MKKTFILLLTIVSAITSFAQVPQLMNYQAVARNAQGQALANQTIKVRLSLVENNNGTLSSFYTETRTITTNTLGLFNVQIGSPSAQATTGSMQGTNWLDSSRTRSLKVELDINNNNTFIDMGSQQLVSVPYALAAKEAVKLAGDAPAFHLEASISETWGTLSVYGFKWDKITLDTHNGFNSSSNQYVIPEDGTYFFYASGSYKNINTGAGTKFGLTINHHNSLYNSTRVIETVNVEGQPYIQWTRKCKKGDKIELVGTLNGSGTIATNYSTYSSFGGFKIR